MTNTTHSSPLAHPAATAGATRRRPLPALALTLLLSAGIGLPAHAELFTSSASSAGSASSGSVSDSIEGSSNSSKGDDTVAEGEYQVMEVAQSAERPGRVRLTLRNEGAAAGHEFFLWVPQQALEARAVATGDRVQAQRRDYGWEFAHADDHQAFFLALDDTWQRDLGSHVVAL
ncbi:MAG: hypothetical protein QM617_07920 [Comamonas sp.]